MIDPEMLAMLRSPIDGMQLHVADDPLIGRVNAAIENGDALDRLDQRVATAIDGGLVTADQRYLFPIRNQIPTLIADEAIVLDHL